LHIGMLSSALEHAIPEQMFTDPNSATKPEGFSTVKALAMAVAQGQKIYTINQQNQAQALQNLRLDSGAMDEIRSSLAAGKEIIAHTDQLTVSGYKGSGYAIIDPVTGEGIYKISGGKNGSFLEALGLGAAVVGAIAMLAGAGSLLIILISILSIVATVTSFLITIEPCGDSRDEIMLWANIFVAAAVGVLGIFGKAGAALAAASAGYIFDKMVHVPLSNSCRII
jgi:hypothetical protein